MEVQDFRQPGEEIIADKRTEHEGHRVHHLRHQDDEGTEHERHILEIFAPKMRPRISLWLPVCLATLAGEGRLSIRQLSDEYTPGAPRDLIDRSPGTPFAKRMRELADEAEVLDILFSHLGPSSAEVTYIEPGQPPIEINPGSAYWMNASGGDTLWVAEATTLGLNSGLVALPTRRYPAL
jgi:hypothetical protein